MLGKVYHSRERADIRGRGGTEEESSSYCVYDFGRELQTLVVWLVLISEALLPPGGNTLTPAIHSLKPFLSTCWTKKVAKQRE